MKKKTIIFCLFIASSVFSQQNLKEEFSPLKSKGNLPDLFTQNIRNIIKKDISDLKKGNENDKSLKSSYITESNYQIERIIKSGNTLVNDEVTVYLNKLADEILKNNPALRKQLHIYTLKSPAVNAYSYDKGYIFLNIGLITQAESEAQLAYVLCHEISHFTKKHNVNSYVKNKKIDRERYSGKSTEDKLIEKCQYSKEAESEADFEGLRLFEGTNYNFKQAEKAFDVLQYAHLPFELVEFKKSFLESAYFKIPDSYFLKEVSSIRNNANEDDSKSTHPNTVKRKIAISELISARNNNGRVNNILGEKQFEYIRDLARFEICRLYLKQRDYPNALYASYILSNKYPNNIYLAETVSKCLYAMTLYSRGQIHYTSDSFLDHGFKSYTEVESFPQQVYHLISKMPANEWTIMSLNYVYRAHKKFPANKRLASMSDSLMKIMSDTNWGVVDFVRTNKKEEIKITAKKDTSEPKSKTEMIATLQKENNFKNYDTAYYKEIFVDLFMNDKEFTSMFPSSGVATTAAEGFSSYTTSSSHPAAPKKHKREKKKSREKIEKVLLLEPFYLKIDESSRDEVKYVESDLKQEKLIETVVDCAQKQDFKLVTLDPKLLSTAEVDKMNDYSVINDWFSEKFDDDDNAKNPILNTNEIESVINKYGTSYVMRTGFVGYKSKRGHKRTFYASFLFDLKTNEIIYKKYETFKGKDLNDLVHAKVYQTFYELKHRK